MALAQIIDLDEVRRARVRGPSIEQPAQMITPSSIAHNDAMPMWCFVYWMPVYWYCG